VDLLERQAGTPIRHPWETARVEAIKSIVGRLPLREPRVLELGCGDAFVLGELQRSMPFGESIAYDLHMNDELLRELTVALPSVRFLRNLGDLSEKEADLVLLLDVLEHIEEPASYLREVVADHLAAGAWVVVTVPAFQALFSQHDHRLRHFRRYSRAQIAEVVATAGLEVVDSGYLFSTLVGPRALTMLGERALPQRRRVHATGIGQWRGSPLMTRALHRALCWDNALCLAAHDHGLDLPGLSAWLTCRKPS
jgi:hypothetical protein